MIEVEYWGGLGNNLFQYCMGRILADKYNYRLKVPPVPGFPGTQVVIDGKDFSKNKCLILSGQIIDRNVLNGRVGNKKLLLSMGFFQRYEYYKKYKDEIRTKWLAPRKTNKYFVNANDVVMCVRRSDYVPKHALPFSYYRDALSKVKYDKVYICSDHPNDPFVYLLKLKYHANIIHDTTLDDFDFIRSFKKIIISNSSFNWWAAFLSDATQIIAPIPKRGYWSRNYKIDLRVDDELRWEYVRCREGYKKSVLEYIVQFLKLIKNGDIF